MLLCAIINLTKIKMKFGEILLLYLLNVFDLIFVIVQ